MYLSRLILNPRSPRARHDLADCQSLHRTILSAFPATTGAGAARRDFGVLHRLEPWRRGAAPVLLAQSVAAPDWSRLPAGYLATTPAAPNPATTSLRPFLDSLRPGETLRFRLRANPTRKVETRSGPHGERRNGRRVTLTTEAEQRAWLCRKAASGGFEVLAVRLAPDVAAVDTRDEGQLAGWRRGPDGQMRRLTFGAVLFEGHLRVGDPGLFQQTLERGVGSGKAYGFGLLSVGSEGG